MIKLPNQRFICLEIESIDQFHLLNGKLDKKINETAQLSFYNSAIYLFRMIQSQKAFIARSVIGNLSDYLLEDFKIIDSRETQLESQELQDFRDLESELKKDEEFFCSILHSVSDGVYSYELALARGGRVPLKYL